MKLLFILDFIDSDSTTAFRSLVKERMKKQLQLTLTGTNNHHEGMVLYLVFTLQLCSSIRHEIQDMCVESLDSNWWMSWVTRQRGGWRRICIKQTPSILGDMMTWRRNDRRKVWNKI